VYYSLQLDIKPALEGDKAGLRSLFDEVMGTATQTKAKEQLNKEIDLIGANINAGSRGGSGSGLKKYEPKMLELLSDMVLNPLFTQEELDLVKGQVLSGLEYINNDADQICNRISKALVYGNGYPDGEVETAETIERITLDDLYNFYNTYFAPNVTRLAIVGDITEAEARANVEKYFGEWKSKNVPVATYQIPQTPRTTKVAMYSKDGAVQSSINLSYPVNYPPVAVDAEAAEVANYILGVGVSSKLFQNLRETNSWTYGVYSFLSEGELTGVFELSSGRNAVGGSASVRANATDSALVQIIKEMNNTINQPITQDELKAVFDGVTYKVSGMGGNQEFTEGPQFDIAKAEAVVCQERDFVKNGYKLTVKGIEKVGDADAYVMEVDKGSAKAMYYFDANTFLIIRYSTAVETPQGNVQQISDLNDYRPAGNVLFLYETVQKVPAMNVEMKMTVTDIQVNTGLTNEDFK